MLNIPIYRAKKIDGDEYVIGYLEKTIRDTYKIIEITKISNKVGGWTNTYNIDQSTLSIHFNDMLASDSDRLLPNGEKDLRIFASLSVDGKGGDNMEYKNSNNKYYAFMDKAGVLRYAEMIDTKWWKDDFIDINFPLFKVIGIQQ